MRRSIAVAFVTMAFASIFPLASQDSELDEDTLKAMDAVAASYDDNGDLGRDSLFEAYITGFSTDGSTGDSLYLGTGVSLGYIVLGGPYLYGELRYLYLGTPVYGYGGCNGVATLIGISFPVAIDTGTYIGLDIAGHFYLSGWSGLVAYDYDAGHWYTNTGSSMDLQARVGARFLTLGVVEDIDDVFFRSSITAHLIYGYAYAENTYGLQSSSTRTREILGDASSLGFLIGLEYSGFASNMRLGLGYYRGFLMEYTFGLGWIF